MSPQSRPPRDPEFLPVYARRQRARRRKRALRRRRLGFAAGIVVILTVALLLAAGFGGAIAYDRGCSLASLSSGERIGENSFVYALDGSRLGGIPSEHNRQPVKWSKISRWMPKATVAVEDKRFYEHGGVDPIGMTRALWADLRAGKVVQGGSTITQQLVRNLNNSREQTVTRKLREACLAVKLAQKWSKRRILKEYLNRVYYGSQAYGVEAAAQTYFSKSADELTLEQSALLAGLPQAPSQYDPVRDPRKARARRNEVLRAMYTTGTISRGQYLHAVRDRDLHLKLGKLYKKIWQPDFFRYVRDELVRVYGERRVQSGGLRVYTTINPRMQHAAQKAIHDTLYYPDDPAAAVVAIDPATGAIRTMTAVDPARRHNQFNLVSQARRQSGSTFKTFVLAAAIEAGMDPYSTYYLSAPLRCDKAPCNPDDPWEPETYDHTYSGSISVDRATLKSDNTVYARLTLDVGAENVAKMARKLGVETPLGVKTRTGGIAYVNSIGLGSREVSPLDMASAYATLAAGGIRSRPMAITKVILPNGKEDTKAGWGKPKRERVISEAVAYEVTRVLEENVQYGTGVAANFGRPAAGKTGTTENHQDAWFVGYTPQLQAAVWVGYSRAEIPMESVHGIAVAGGTFPAEIWHDFMEKAVARKAVRSFTVPNEAPTFRDWHGEWQWNGTYYDPDSYSDSEPPAAPPPPPVSPPPPPASPTGTTPVSPPPPPASPTGTTPG